jgi:Rho GTPase-activating protein 1
VLLEHNVTAEGLFRVPPHSKLRDVMKEAYDRGQKYIIWKDNGVTLPLPPYPNAEQQDEILAEVDPKDAYSVFMAAALIKAWYASLRQPIFPTTSYGDLKRLYGDPQDVPDLDRLKDLFSPSSEWSLLPGISREIVTRHLLPLLHAVASRQEQNKMTAENLAVCFAPGLLCGPDQIEDAKMSSIIRRIFTYAIDLWPNGLRDACEQSEHVFYQELRLPKDDADWEDPVEEKREAGQSMDSLEEQASGITLEDNEKSNEAYSQPYPEVEHEDMPPPLPPRTRVPSTRSSTESGKRKPAPPLLQTAPPRYSTIISDAPADVAESPLTYAATTDGFAPRRQDDDRPSSQPRWDEVSHEKSGMRTSTSSTSSSSAIPSFPAANSPTSSSAAKLHIPKRKTLTAAQVDNIGKSIAAPTHASASSPLWRTYDSIPRRGSQPMALPGLNNLPSLSTDAPLQSPKRAPPPIPTSTQSERAPPFHPSSPLSPSLSPSSATEFRRPSIPASASRTPTITGLARPVYPSHPPMPNRPPSKSTSLPVPPGPKPRTVSPGLLRRMPSFEARGAGPGIGVERKMLTPNKLNLKKQSVEDLRRLYEERAGTASVLVEAGRWNR